MHAAVPALSSGEIRAARPPKNKVDSRRPYAYLVEPECSPDGKIEDIATVFLTNRECPFTCLMCDLWKNTLDEPVQVGDIPAQIEFALSQLPAATHIKLYNSGNFFDAKAIPLEDHPAIASLTRGFKTVIVENHPRLCGGECVRFRESLDAELEVALGLETTHPSALRQLNKQMTLDDFQRATEFLLTSGIHVRAFILLKPPLLSDEEGIEWTIRSIEHAFSLGVRCCSVIPTRAGNGIMDQLQASAQFAPPKLSSMEAVQEAGIRLQKGRVFVDLWDAKRFSECARCCSARLQRMHEMNLTQQVLPAISCDCEQNYD